MDNPAQPNEPQRCGQQKHDYRLDHSTLHQLAKPRNKEARQRRNYITCRSLCHRNNMNIQQRTFNIRLSMQESAAAAVVMAASTV